VVLESQKVENRWCRPIRGKLGTPRRKDKVVEREALEVRVKDPGG